MIGAYLEDSNATGVNDDQTDNSASDSGAAYVFVRDEFGNWSQQAYLKASNTDAGDAFGRSVAVSGDTVVVGAVGEDSSATGVNWSQQAYLKASNTEAGDFFGRGVAVSGDTVVVGARGEDSSATGVNGNQSDNSATDSGAAYIFVRDGGGNWSQHAYLKASNTDAEDFFGLAEKFNEAVLQLPNGHLIQRSEFLCEVQFHASSPSARCRNPRVPLTTLSLVSPDKAREFRPSGGDS